MSKADIVESCRFGLCRRPRVSYRERGSNTFVHKRVGIFTIVEGRSRLETLWSHRIKSRDKILVHTLVKGQNLEEDNFMCLMEIMGPTWDWLCLTVVVVVYRNFLFLFFPSRVLFSCDPTSTLVNPVKSPYSGENKITVEIDTPLPTPSVNTKGTDLGYYEKFGRRLTLKLRGHRNRCFSITWLISYTHGTRPSWNKNKFKIFKEDLSY